MHACTRTTYMHVSLWMLANPLVLYYTVCTPRVLMNGSMSLIDTLHGGAYVIMYVQHYIVIYYMFVLLLITWCAQNVYCYIYIYI